MILIMGVMVMRAYLSVPEAGALPFRPPHAAGAAGRIGV
jgi:hypothetical protein